MNLNEINFQFAFQFMGQDAKTEKITSKDDPTFVRIVVEVYGEEDGEMSVSRELPYHKCTEEEFAEFYPIVEDEKNNLENLKGGFNCIDWKDEDPYLVYGDFANGSTYQALNIFLVPCNYDGEYIKSRTIEPECNTDP